MKLDEVLTMKTEIKMSKTQKFLFSKLSPEKQSDYLATFTGKKSWDLYSELRPQSETTDKLSNKREGSVYRLFNSLSDATSDKRPYPTSFGEWIGVEIECFLPLDSVGGYVGSSTCNCDECGGSGRESCEHCGGDGDISVECHQCDGHGTIEVDGESGETETIDCEDCSGSGEDIVACTHCENGVVECNSCGGSGECSSDDNEYSEKYRYLADEIENAGIRGASIREDGSINCDTSEFFPVEITLLYRRHKSEDLKKLTDLLKNLGAQVNKSCGLHVHLDSRDLFDGDRLLTTRLKRRERRLVNALGALLGLVPSSRRVNSYCEPQSSGLNGSRYSAINLTSLKRHKTIEIRLHSGSVIFEKINNWVNLLYTISRSRTLTNHKARSVRSLAEKIDMTPEMLSYFQSREDKFSSNSENSHDEVA